MTSDNKCLSPMTKAVLRTLWQAIKVTLILFGGVATAALIIHIVGVETFFKIATVLLALVPITICITVWICGNYSDILNEQKKDNKKQ